MNRHATEEDAIEHHAPGEAATGNDATDDQIVRDGELGGLDPAQLGARYGTPFYAYDLDVIERAVGRLRPALPARFDLAYAVKANPALAVVAHLGSLGLGADVASGGELELVSRAGIAPEDVVFTGPGKRDEELLAAVDAGLRAVTVESAGELARLEAIAAGRGRRTPVLLRMAKRFGSSAMREPASSAWTRRRWAPAPSGRLGRPTSSCSDCTRSGPPT
jgi:diaminopimelate decarboxylase